MAREDVELGAGNPLFEEDNLAKDGANVVGSSADLFGDEEPSEPFFSTVYTNLKERNFAHHKVRLFLLGCGLSVAVVALIGISVGTGSQTSGPTDGPAGAPTVSPTRRPTLEGETWQPTASPTETGATPSPTGSFNEKGNLCATGCGSSNNFFPKFGMLASTQPSLDAYLESAVEVAWENIGKSISNQDNLNDWVEGDLYAASPFPNAFTPSGDPLICPNYRFTWARDQALVFTTYLNVYENSNNAADVAEAENVLKKYANHAHVIYEQNVVGEIFDLGDAKYFMNGKRFNGGWCQPQNDGPALRATVLIRFAKKLMERDPVNGRQYVENNLYKSNPGFSDRAPIKRDLDYLVEKWRQKNCEPWEEILGNHFYDKLMVRRAFIDGAAFATLMSDSNGASRYADSGRMNTLNTLINDHWRSDKKTIQPEENNQAKHLDDIQTVLASLHSYAETDDTWDAANDRSLANALFSIQTFHELYKINRPGFKNMHDLGIAMGRYVGDKYSGNIGEGDCNWPEDVCPSPCGGQPWFLATNGLAEFMYRAASQFIKAKQITVTNLSRPFWNYFGGASVWADHNLGTSGNVVIADSNEAFDKLIAILVHSGDAQLRRTRYHTNEGYRLDEQFNGETGVQMSAMHLTWSYASLVTAKMQRDLLDLDSLFTRLTPADGVVIELIVTEVPSDVEEVQAYIVPSTGASKVCHKLHKRRTVFGLSQWSSFVKVGKNTEASWQVVKVAAGATCDPTTTVPSDSPPPFKVTTSSKNPVQPVYESWCRSIGLSSGTCAGVGHVPISIAVAHVPNEINGKVVRAVGIMPFDGTTAIPGVRDQPCNEDNLSAITSEKTGDDWVVDISSVKTDTKFLYKAFALTSDSADVSSCDSSSAFTIEIENGIEGSVESHLGPLFGTHEPFHHVWGCAGCVAPDIDTTLVHFEITIPNSIQGYNAVLLGGTFTADTWVPCNMFRTTSKGNDGSNTHYSVNLDLKGESTFQFKPVLLYDCNDPCDGGCNTRFHKDGQPNSDETVNVIKGGNNAEQFVKVTFV